MRASASCNYVRLSMLDDHRTRYVSKLLSHLATRLRAYMYFSWPFPPSSPSAKMTFYDHGPGASPARNLLDRLPTDLLFYIIRHLPLTTFLFLSSTCRKLRTLLTEHRFLGRIVKELMTDVSRCLYWIRPAASLNGEVDRAEEGAKEWLTASLTTSPYDQGQSELGSLGLTTVPCLRLC